MTISHPTMTARQFDTALHRAHCNGLRVIPTGVAGVVFVTSGSRTNRVHRVTRTSCTCEAGRRGIGCQHVALAVFEADVMGTIGRRKPAAPAVFLHRRATAQSAQEDFSWADTYFQIADDEPHLGERLARELGSATDAA